jgi:hypothetical protein
MKYNDVQLFLHEAVMEALDHVHYARVETFSDDSIKLDEARRYNQQYFKKYGYTVRDY